MNLRKLVVILSTIMLFCSSIAFAGVNLKNGNFYISYTDMIMHGEHLEVVRTYNSKSTDRGIFGYGWGSDYETFLSILPDKSIVVHENGSGANNDFESPERDKKAYEEGIQQIIAVAKKLKEVSTPDSVEELEKKLRSSAELLERYWLKYRKKGLVETPNIPVGTVLESDNFGLQTIKRIQTGYIRTHVADGKKEYFNKDGYMTRITEKNGSFINLTYDDDDNLKTLTDHLGGEITFTFTSDGVVEKLVGKDSNSTKQASYRYSKKNELIEAKDVVNNVFKYEYDHNYNLTQISYADGTNFKISYTVASQFVESTEDRDGEKTFYEYKSNSNNDFGTIVKKIDSSGKVISENKYWYKIKTDEFGNSWTHKIITTVNGRETETEYNERGTPIAITKDGIRTQFAYNAAGLLVRKETQDYILEMTYHERHNKITRIEQTYKESKTKSWTFFKYNIAGDLTYAENSSGQMVTLEYNDKGQIKTLTGKNSSKISFEYNKIGKPTKIVLNEDGETGAINVTYDGNGEIEKVESDEGHKMALRVTQAFQNLLSLVKVAGVNLSF